MTTQLVSAYTDLEKNQKVEEADYDAMVLGDVVGYSPEGLEVEFLGAQGLEIPVTAQYFIEWEPVVYAVWNEENNGEDGNSEDGSEVGTRGEESPQESDPELGLPGSGHAGEQPAEA